MKTKSAANANPVRIAIATVSQTANAARHALVAAANEQHTGGLHGIACGLSSQLNIRLQFL